MGGDDFARLCRNQQGVKECGKLTALALAWQFDELSKALVELITCMTAQGISGPKIELQVDEPKPTTKEAGREVCFQSGWKDFLTYTSHKLGIGIREGEAMNGAIQDMALLIGSRKTHQNEEFQSLKELMKTLCASDTEDKIKIVGLKAVRAMIYMNPDLGHVSKQHHDDEFQLMLDNKPPSSLGQPSLMQIQCTVAALGGVDVISNCIESENNDVIMASLQLAVTLLDGGNIKVQDLFATTLRQPSSQPFFLKYRNLFQESVGAIREQKRAAKQQRMEKAALEKAGIAQKAEEAQKSSLADSQKPIVEVMKSMRRMCMGQYRPLQDILREQRLNSTSIDFFGEAVAYIKNLEPEIKDAIHDGDFEIVEGAMRGFLMLADAMRGPNLGNQKAIAETGIFDLCDRIFARIRFEHVDPELDDQAWELKKNNYRCQLKSAVTVRLKESVLLSVLHKDGGTCWS
jgi:hypothetical protein